MLECSKFRFCINLLFEQVAVYRLEFDPLLHGYVSKQQLSKVLNDEISGAPRQPKKSTWQPRRPWPTSSRCMGCLAG